MTVRKSNILAAACNTLHSFPLGASQSSTSSIWQRQGTRQQESTRCIQNGYATIAGDAKGASEHLEGKDSNHVWPTAPKGQSCPTPYQIFDLKHNAAYSKAQYYRLVKLYHPDLNGTASKKISDQVKMERYRLIVAAHNSLRSRKA